MYPVPAFRSPTVRFVATEIGTRTEYMAAEAIPTARMYLIMTRTRLATWKTWDIETRITYMHKQVRETSFRRGLQFNGSSG